VFQASPVPGAPATFPATLALVGAAFTAMLQLSLVCERWPLGDIGRLWSGIAALAVFWTAGTGAYFLLVNLDAVPAAERAAAGLCNPGGPIAGPGFGSALIAFGVWQAVFFIALRGWPVNTITRRSRRLLAGNALVLGLGALTYITLRNLASRPASARPGPCPDSRPHRPGRAHAQPRPGRLCRRRALDKSHPGRVDHHRRAQLHRSRHHPARRHRPPLAIRTEGNEEP